MADERGAGGPSPNPPPDDSEAAGVGAPSTGVQAARPSRAHRARLYALSAAVVVLLAVIVGLVAANTGSVEVSWVFGSTHQPLVWIIFVTAVVAWLLGVATAALVRYRATPRRRRDRAG